MSQRPDESSSKEPAKQEKRQPPAGMERVADVILQAEADGEVVFEQRIGGLYADPYVAEELAATKSAIGSSAKACLATDPHFAKGYEAIFGKKSLPGEAEMN